MTLDQIQQAQSYAFRVTNAACGIGITSESYNALCRAEDIMEVVRTFAESWDETRKMDDEGKYTKQEAERMRKFHIDILLSALIPTRF